MMHTRRAILSLCASAPLLAVSPSLRANPPLAEWYGTALGGTAQIKIAGLSNADAQGVFKDVEQELNRLEDIFSLYRTNSDLTQLNALGKLKRPKPELLEVLSIARRVWHASEGAFDPTIQSLWRARFNDRPAPAPTGSFGDVSATLDGVDFGGRPLQLTLNGIAQGYIADQISMLLRRAGLQNTAVNAGELRTTGTGTSGNGWRTGIVGTDGAIATQLLLQDRALATSDPMAMLLPGRTPHIWNATTGRPLARPEPVSVLADTAALADAISTACACLDRRARHDLVAHFSGTELVPKG